MAAGMAPLAESVRLLTVTTSTAVKMRYQHSMHMSLMCR